MDGSGGNQYEPASAAGGTSPLATSAAKGGQSGSLGKVPQAAGQAEQVSGRTRWQGGHGLNPEQALSQRTLAASASFKRKQVHKP